MPNRVELERYFSLVRENIFEGQGIDLCIWKGQFGDICGLPDGTATRKRRGKCLAAENATLQMECRGFKLDYEGLVF